MKEVFDQVLLKMEEQLNQNDFNRWLKPLRYRYSSDDILSVEAPNIFFIHWISDNYLTEFKKLLSKTSGRDMEVDLVVSSGDGDGKKAPAVSASSAPAAEAVPEIDSGLNSKYTFSSFVVGSSNQLAHAASFAVASGKASYNPLFIYGESGLGKTHLLHSIGNLLSSQDSSKRVVFRSSESFTNELIEAMRYEKMGEFRQKYRNIHALLIDDIHFIGGRERTQEEFFYTFNALYEADRQVVLTSDKVPNQIPDLEKRLRSRFEGGLFADISAPDQETKVAILAKKAEEENINLSNEVAFYLASHDESNVRVLEGHLSRLGAYASMTKEKITLEMAQKLLGQFFVSENKQVTLDKILRVTAGFFNVKVNDLKSAKKQQAIAVPRQAAMSLARKLTSLSTIEIGRRIGGRDHSTVIHADNKMQKRAESDREFARTLMELEQTIKGSKN